MTATMETGLDLDRLEKVKLRGKKTIARCPACAEAGADKKGEHLVIQVDGRFGCIQFQGVDGETHRKRIWELAGTQEPSNRGSGPTQPGLGSLEEAIKEVGQRINKSKTRCDRYITAEGKTALVVARFDGAGGKEFRPFHKNGVGWKIGDPPGKLPLFELPDLLSRAHEEVYVVEGEKCACELGTVGLLATTSAHGAKSPHKTDWTPLAGRNVNILPDNDEEGQGYARKATRILGELTPPARVRVIHLPNLPPKGDCVDWLEQRDAQAPEDIRAELTSLLANQPAIALPPGGIPGESGWLEVIAKSVVSSSEMASLSLQPREKLLGDFFYEADLGFIYAYRGVGKTWLALFIARALSEGSAAGPWKAHAPTKVLYVDGEMPADLMRARDGGLRQATGEIDFLNHEVLFDRSQRVLNITNPEVQQAITDYCLSSGVRVIILDNLSTLASGMKENDSFAWELVNNWLLQFRRHKIAVIVVHHAGRNGEARGTSKREDAAFWVIALDDAKKHADDKTGARFISRFTKPSRNAQEETPTYEWHVTTDPFTGEISVTHKLAQSLDVFRRLIEDGVTECSLIAEEMKVSKGTVSKWAKKAEREGWLKIRNRQYILIDGNEEL